MQLDILSSFYVFNGYGANFLLIQGSIKSIQLKTIKIQLKLYASINIIN